MSLHPHTSVHPKHPYAPAYPPCTSVCSSYTICSPYVMGTLGASVHPICLGVLGGSGHLSGISVSVSTLICFSVDNSHTSCSRSLWVASLLDWMPMGVCCASCCCSFCEVFSICLKLPPPLLCVGGAFCYSVSCLPAIPTLWWGIQLWGLGRESPHPSTFPAC